MLKAAKNIKKLSRRNSRLLMSVILVAVAGTILTLALRAASPTIHFEAESGSRTANATTAADAAASGGQYLKFNTPSGTGSCALPNYPDESCTGVQDGITLTIVNGDVNINTPNTIYENKNVKGCIFINNVSNITIRNVIAECIINYDEGNTGFRVTVEDSIIDCNGPGTGFGEANFLIRRVEITDCENGLDINQYVTIEDSYIHELYENLAIDTHTDGMQMAAGYFLPGNPNPILNGAREVIVRHNTIYAYNRVSGLHGTSSIITNPGGDTNVLIEDNLMAGGAYTLYCPRPGTGTNFRVLRNRFSQQFSQNVGAFGAWDDCGDETEVVGNVFHESGLPVPF